MGDYRLSRFLSRLLRHDLDARGITKTPEGYVYIDDILLESEASRYKVEDVEKVVRLDDKGRFEIRTYNGRKQIKATQGHSIKIIGGPTFYVTTFYRDVQVSTLEHFISTSDMTPITHVSEARVVLHGTRSSNWDSIKREGLSRRRREHIHFAQGESNVKSGFPPHCDIAIEIDLEKALRDGVKFYKSSNDVVLSPGNADGFLLPKYFKKAYNIRTRETLTN